MSVPPFRPAPWLPGGHAQTLWPVLFRRAPLPPVQRETLTLPDGDALQLAWTQAGQGSPPALILPGLEGGLGSHYIPGLMRGLVAQGWQPVVMHHRGTGGEPNRLQRRYTGGDTADLAFVAERLGERFPRAPLGAVGFSLGGNLLLKWLGEVGSEGPLTAAAAVSPPFQLARAADRLDSGVSRLYQRHLLKCIRQSLRTRHASFPGSLPFPPRTLDRLGSFWAFDAAFTAPVHGYADVADYYQRASARPYLPAIQVPTLIIHARDDPMTTPDAIPGVDELGPGVQMECFERGGHVGFVAGVGGPVYWLEQRLPSFFTSV